MLSLDFTSEAISLAGVDAGLGDDDDDDEVFDGIAGDAREEAFSCVSAETLDAIVWCEDEPKGDKKIRILSRNFALRESTLVKSLSAISED